ncbi:MAG: arsenate reductase (glutaredoxin) [Brevundimonas sp.]|uniref:arsenate reductase (glutaredoxin) n=1 Tax=Brevundimonas sp. TaxID=1871086 RepID=UPI0027282F04|nr:arsenate reductase (glutaredoxin) [Brevundimonas sp.]MDO9586795.1 arsenate reductase (glutaredoxin) [Brevundimonas sp.]MDP3658053.1 arsenate reductase (glutaredoxin) [Brevundimonas sp.]MDZ4067317.1 arsenate reductase (glutaredoxin) [Tabrizicola sp.]MDZ4320113.1 arsenate reductase (glutaredoxin) [Phenylobacterium sp.]
MSDAFPVTIFHNPACGTSRNVVAMVEAAGYRPEVVEYLQAGWTPVQLRALFAEAGISPRQALREKGTPAAELGLLDPEASEAAILAAMVEHPVLVNRPIVRTPKGAAMCRPSERVFDLLERAPGGFVKEDGEVVIPASSGAAAR